MKKSKPKMPAGVFGVTVIALCLAWSAALLPVAVPAADAHLDPKLGLVSDIARGVKRYLVIMVDFPDVQPRQSLEALQGRAVTRVDRWFKSASYGQTGFMGTCKGPYTLPQPVAAYKVSPYNFQVDPRRVYALVRDALSLAEADGTAINDFDVAAIVHRCHTGPGQGYGMVCYCANPGMLSRVRHGRAAYVPVTTRRGTGFQKGVVVMAENFHLGFMVHDLAHAIAGVQQGERLVVDLYDFEDQSRPRTVFHITDSSLFLGPWDIMSQHFLERSQPPPGFSLFSKIRLGYVRPDQVTLVRPGDTALVRLAALAAGGPILGVKVPLSRGRYLLVENRQRLEIDRVLPASGVMIYEVDESRQEGAGQVRAMNADPAAPNFSRAPFGVEEQARIAYVDAKKNVAVIPIAQEDADYVVLVTSPAQAGAGESVARNLMRLKGSPGYGARLSQAVDLLKSGRVEEAEKAAR